MKMVHTARGARGLVDIDVIYMAIEEATGYCSAQLLGPKNGSVKGDEHLVQVYYIFVTMLRKHCGYSEKKVGEVLGQEQRSVNTLLGRIERKLSLFRPEYDPKLKDLHEECRHWLRVLKPLGPPKLTPSQRRLHAKDKNVRIDREASRRKIKELQAQMDKERFKLGESDGSTSASDPKS